MQGRNGASQQTAEFELHRFLRLLARIPGFDGGRYREAAVGRNKATQAAIAADYTGEVGKR